MCIRAWVCVYSCSCDRGVHIYMQAEARDQYLLSFLAISPPYFLRQGGQQAPGNALSLPPQHWIMSMLFHFWLSMGAGNPNSGILNPYGYFNDRSHYIGHATEAAWPIKPRICLLSGTSKEKGADLCLTPRFLISYNSVVWLAHITDLSQVHSGTCIHLRWYMVQLNISLSSLFPPQRV